MASGIPASEHVPQQSVGGYHVLFVVMLHLLHSVTNVQEITLLETSHYRKWGQKVQRKP